MLSTEIDPAFAIRARYIADALQKFKPQRVLDVGCGRGFYVKLASTFASIDHIEGVDINSDYVAQAKKNVGGDKRISIQKGSIYKLPFTDNYFDLIICSEVLEHLDDEKTALSELYRVLTKGGKLIVTVPNKNFPFLWDPLNWLLMRFFDTHVDKNIWWLAGIWADHERLYSLSEIKTLLNTKFQILNSELVLRWCWPFSHFLLYGIGKNLVERMGISNFNRFDFEKQSPFAKALALFIAFPEKIVKRDSKTSRVAVNIVITSTKTYGRLVC